MNLDQIMDTSINISQFTSGYLSKDISTPYYHILVFEGPTSFSVDFTTYDCDGKTVLFLSPYQHLKWHQSSASIVYAIRFHGDFYCIEYHKKEVACNGILFNNIYRQPHVAVSDSVFQEIVGTVAKMQDLQGLDSQYDVSITKTYLQLILALSSKEKQLRQISATAQFENVVDFQRLLDENFLQTREIAFYAAKSGLAVNTFTKKIKKNFGKTPSKLIQERIVLEAKKLLHLTYKPIKEIAADLNFEDEFYFSRYFKKEVGVSPKQFREKVGISIVAQ